MQVYLDAIPARIAILDRGGVLVDANTACREFIHQQARGLADDGIGSPFLDILEQVFDMGTSWARTCAQGIKDVLAGRRTAYAMRFPIEAEGDTSWFAMEVRCLPTIGGAIVTQDNVTARVRSEQALRDSEQRYNLATSAANVWVWERNFKTGTWYIDPGMKTFAGYTTRDMTDSMEDWRRLLPPADMATLDAHVHAAFVGEIPELDFEHRIIHRDGSYRWVRARGKITRDADGQPVRMLGTSVDITKSRTTEEALKRSEAKQRALIESIPDMIVRVGSDGTILAYKNPRPTSDHIDPDTVVGDRLDAVLPPAVFQAVETAALRVIDTGEVETIEYRVGEAVAARIFETRLVASGDREVVGVIRDITERKKAEDLLRSSHGRLERQVQDRTRDLVAARKDLASETVQRRKTAELLRMREEEYRITFDNAPLGLTTVDEQGRFIHVNQALCNLLGFTEGELLQMTFTDFTHPDDIDRSMNLFNRTKEGTTRGARSMPKRYLRKDGGIVDAMVHTMYVPGTDAQPGRLVAQIEDRTEQLRAQEELRQQRERLAHVSRVSTLGEMAAGIAHEVNQPLTAIANYAQACTRMVQSDETAGPDVLDVLSHIRDESLRAGEIIHRLRDLARRRASRRSRCNLNAIIREVLTLVDADARHQDVELRTEFEEELEDVIVDAVQIQQVVLNLVRNAIEAMAGGNTRPCWVEIRTKRGDGPQVEVSVVDNGPGIPDQNGRKIYRPFYTTKESGMGMGLSISRSIVTSHRGTLQHTTNPDGGAVFRFALPTVHGVT
jgi:two-component system sensor kinase FixL